MVSSRTRIPAMTTDERSISCAVRHHFGLRENKATVIEIMNPRRAAAEMPAATDSIVSMNRTTTLPLLLSVSVPNHHKLFALTNLIARH